MPELPSSLVGSWVGSNFNDYHNTGNAEQVKKWLDIAVAFRNERQVPIFCDEFGVFIPNSDNEDRVAWYELVTSYLDEHNIGWTMWDYQGGFGLFEKGSQSLFDHDLNVPLLEAIGFYVPPQTDFVIQTDSTGFPFYTDYIEWGVIGIGNSPTLNRYETASPNNGIICIHWAGMAQYNLNGFDLIPDKDLTALVENGYALDMMVRGDSPGTRFQIRFVDSKVSDIDHPWRISATVDETLMKMNGTWNHIHIPLSEFSETGSWDSGSWYTSEGKFDWSAIDRFEMVAEFGGLEKAQFWFDNIHVTEVDTALIFDSSVYSNTVVLFDTLVETDITVLTDLNRFTDTLDFSDTLSYTVTISLVDTLYALGTNPVLTEDANCRFYPNPFHSDLTVQSSLPGRITVQIVDVSGRLHRKHTFIRETELELSGLPEGLYIFRVSDGKSVTGQFSLNKE